MQTKISVRHGQLSDATRSKIAAKLEKLHRVFERLTAIEVTVDLERKDSASVELLVSAEHKHDFVATETAADVMTAVDGVLPKLEQQLRKYKEKVQDHHRSPVPRQGGISSDLEAGGQ
ncbi:MAG: ribosome-associated translation inhibitor RaiA [Planctomycetaceae bacterium]|nr:ribosome-associated translation inhibitor RaiA [Planctomycetaceae bacterium]